MSLISLIIIIGIILAIISLVALLIAKQYKKVGPNEVLIVSGGRKKGILEPDGTRRKVGYRYQLGGGTFVWPFLETYDILPVDVINIQIKTPEVLTNGGILIMAEAAAQVKIGSDEHSIHVAAEQFLGSGKDGIRDVAAIILDGKMRAIIGTMTVEEIFRNRIDFAEKVVQAAGTEISRLGLTLLSFSLKEMSDAQGYLDALGKPQIAAAKRDATIAEAETEKEAIIKSSEARKESEVARLNAEAQIAKAQWENEAKKAESQVTVNSEKGSGRFCL